MYSTTLYIQYKSNFSHARVHDNEDDEAASQFQLEKKTVDRELVHQVSSQEREVGHQWTCLNTKSFLARTFLEMYSYTTALFIQ